MSPSRALHVLPSHAMKIRIAAHVWIISLTSLAGCISGGPSIDFAVTEEDYVLTWQDEFDYDGAPNPKHWNYESGFVRNEELQWYQPGNAFCENGKLIIEARRERRANPY